MIEREDFPDLANARALWARGESDAALAAFDASVEARPENVKALIEAARAFGGRFDIEKAEGLLERAQRIGADDSGTLALIAASYGRIYRESRAIHAFEAMDDRVAFARAELAALYERSGRLDEALAEIEICCDMAKDAPEPRLAKARILRRKGQRDSARLLLQALTGPEGQALLRAEALSELCYIEDLNGNATEAANAIAAAHAILRALPDGAHLLERARANNRLIQRMAREFRAGTLKTWREAAPANIPTAHLTGFPRSGTTLLEQFLDAHPGLVASPERVVFTRDILPRLCNAAGGPLSVATLNNVPPEVQRKERDRYLTYMAAALGAPFADRVHLDKNPNHTGLIPALLRLDPHARIVFALRDPRDVVTSCVMRSFRPTEFSAMLMDWGTACELYATEMGAWLRYRERIPAHQWVETRYEDMVADPMAEVRRILPVLGLEWDEAILGWQKRLDGKVVNSPTQTEVRQPVHRNAVGRWQAYRQYLQPHLNVLAPFIKAFGYA